MENDSRSQPEKKKPRKVIGSYLRGGHSRPFTLSEKLAIEAWKKQLELDGQLIFIKPRKVIGSYLRGGRHVHHEVQPTITMPRKVIFSYFRRPQAA
jgi:hypothetical protein